MNRLTVWLNHGLKEARWPASRTARVSLIAALVLVILGVYLVQSSQIVAANRHVEVLREELSALRRQNALKLDAVSQATNAATLLERAKALGFVPAEVVEFITVATNVRDDVPSLRDVYVSP